MSASSGAQELSLVVWCLALGSLEQVCNGPEYKSLRKEMVGGVNSGLGGLHCRSVPLVRGLLLRGPGGNERGGRPRKVTEAYYWAAQNNGCPAYAC